MAVARWLETDSLSNQNISSALAIGAYTADADRMIVCDVSLDQVAGGGDYVIYITRQINGAGSAYVLLPKTTCAAASGETAIAMQSGPITVRSGDVLTVYVDGLAGDTTTPDTTVRWFEMAALRPATADRQVTVAATGEAAVNVTYSAGVALAGRLAEYADVSPLALEATAQAILEDTGTTLPAALVTIDGIVDDILVDTGTTLPALINTRATLGAGALTFTYTLLSSVDESPIADADVWVSSDEAGSILLASGRTNASGQVVFYLDAGTVYVWRQKSGWNFTNPDTETVS